MAESEQERTEEATAKRREEFRDEGKIAKSKDLVAMLILSFCGYLLLKSGSHIFKEFQETFIEFLDIAVKQKFDDLLIVFALKNAFSRFFSMISTVFFCILLITVIGHLAQSGFIWTIKPLEPDFGRINPLNGLGRLFKFESIFEILKSFVKLFVLVAITYFLIKDNIFMAFSFSSLSIEQIFSVVQEMIGRLIIGTFAFMLFMSLLDYLYQRYLIEQSMKMTKQEIKSEHKEREGDPVIKSRIRSLQRSIAQKRTMKEIPKADVIITNPTHLAVAIKYDPNSMSAPKVIAKGADFMATRIRELAKLNNIPIVENKPLARVLFKTVKVGHSIPREFYQALAEVLIYVYRLKGKAKNFLNQ